MSTQLFTDRAHQMLGSATYKAQNHSCVSTIHVLQELVDNEHAHFNNLIVKAGGDSDAFNQMLEAMAATLGPNENPELPVPYADDLEDAIQAANKCRHEWRDWRIDLDTIILALLEPIPSAIGGCLDKAGITRDKLKEVVKAERGTRVCDHPAGGVYDVFPTVRHCTDSYTLRVSMNDLGKPIKGRSAQLDAINNIIQYQPKQSIVLTGPAGVGKTELVKEFARQSWNAKCRHHVVALTKENVLEDTKYVGTLDKRTKALLKELKLANELGCPILVFVGMSRSSTLLTLDEIHTFFPLRDISTIREFSQALKVPLADGDCRIIAATTTDEFNKYVAPDPAFVRRLEPVFISEPSQREAVQIMRGMGSAYEEEHQVDIEDAAVKASVYLGARYLVGANPSASRKALQGACVLAAERRGNPFAREIREARDELDMLRGEMPWLDRKKTGEDKAAVDARDIELRITELEKLLVTYQASAHPSARPTVTAQDVKRSVERTTGVPLVESDIPGRVRALKEYLEARIYGQTAAITSFCRSFHASLLLQNPHSPSVVAYFAGPTCTGKTLMTMMVSEFLFGPDKVFRVDAASQDPAYVSFLLNSKHNSSLVVFLRNNPRCVIRVTLPPAANRNTSVMQWVRQLVVNGQIMNKADAPVPAQEAIVIFEVAAGTGAREAQQSVYQYCNGIAIDFAALEADSIRKGLEAVMAERARAVMAGHELELVYGGLFLSGVLTWVTGVNMTLRDAEIWLVAAITKVVSEALIDHDLPRIVLGWEPEHASICVV